jgi:3-phosphoshikimate 1-carboxyvinyltransferase
MDYLVSPSVLNNDTITVPGDKSITHRALILASIADGESEINGYLNSDDCLSTLRVLKKLGIRIEKTNSTKIIVNGVGLDGLTPPGMDLDLGNSGTSMRLLAGLLSGQSFDTTLVGDKSLSARPMKRIIYPLSLMGANIQSDRGFPPLTIKAVRHLEPINYEIPIASAQVKSAILFSALYAKGHSVIKEKNITRDHTEKMFSLMGISMMKKDGSITIKGKQTPKASSISIPADLSSASFFIVAALISKNSELLITDVGINPTRCGILSILREMGANIKVVNKRFMSGELIADIFARSSKLKGIDISPEYVSLSIDEFPILFIAAAMADGVTKFSGIHELRVKESDRISSMVTGLKTLGIKVDEQKSGAIIQGGNILGGIVNSNGDHRIAMAFAIAGSRSKEIIRIIDTDVVNTSFPDFLKILKNSGIDITEEPSDHE